MFRTMVLSCYIIYIDKNIKLTENYYRLLNSYKNSHNIN